METAKYFLHKVLWSKQAFRSDQFNYFSFIKHVPYV